MGKPTLILINGLPCTGKSTLAAQLARRLALPLFSKDQFKEILFDTLGTGDRAWSRRLGAASTEALFSVAGSALDAGVSALAESNFDPELGAAHVRALQQRHGCALAQVLCVAEGQALWERYRRRAAGSQRHPGHLDHILLDELRPQLLRGRADPMALDGPLLEVDTTDLAAIDVAAVAAWLRAQLDLPSQP